MDIIITLSDKDAATTLARLQAFYGWTEMTQDQVVENLTTEIKNDLVGRAISGKETLAKAEAAATQVTERAALTDSITVALKV